MGHGHLYLTGAEICVPSHCHSSMEYLIPANTYILTFYVLAKILVGLFFTKDNETIMNDIEEKLFYCKRYTWIFLPHCWL